jgi:hypothetical protein
MNTSLAAKAGLYLDTLDAQRLKKIRDLEAYERPSKAEVEPHAQKPVFITPLNRYDREIHLNGSSCSKKCSLVCSVTLTLNQLLFLCENWYGYYATSRHPTFNFFFSRLSNTRLHRPLPVRTSVSRNFLVYFSAWRI